MQCPISVEGKECGAEAHTADRWTDGRDEAITMHFSCRHGHRFHIGPRERWQACCCFRTEGATIGLRAMPCHDAADVLLATLAAEKGIQLIVPPKPRP